MRNRIESTEYSVIADELGVSVADVRKVVSSFFGTIVSDSRGLPFNNVRKIYGKDVFDSMATVRNIPFVGRIGPVYSRYLKWRGNDAKKIRQEPRARYRGGITRDEIENMAADILSGRTPAPLVRKRGNEMYNRVWLVGADGKRQARQVIPKEGK